MLSLVDYTGSDEEDFDEEENEECIHAEVVSNPKKRLTSTRKDDRTTDGSRRQDDAVMGEYDSITSTGKACCLCYYFNFSSKIVIY